MTTALETLMKKKRAMEAELQAEGANALKASFKEFFDAHPECDALQWSQYTPYFNDGSECVFRVGEFLVRTIPGTSFDWRSYDRAKYNPAQLALFEAVDNLEGIDTEFYEIAFGDHVRVTATREGFTVEEYEHD